MVKIALTLHCSRNYHGLDHSEEANLMETSILLAQTTTALLLLLATPVALRCGLPSTEPMSRLWSELVKSLRPAPRPRRVRRVAMRGARPWWE